jgi:hypothetical protein
VNRQLYVFLSSINRHGITVWFQLGTFALLAGTGPLVIPRAGASGLAGLMGLCELALCGLQLGWARYVLRSAEGYDIVSAWPASAPRSEPAPAWRF